MKIDYIYLIIFLAIIAMFGLVTADLHAAWVIDNFLSGEQHD